MKNILHLVLLLLPSGIHAQTVLFAEGFEGPTPAFNLNTTDVSSVANGANSWLINAAYSGGAGEIDCLGLGFSFTVPPTAGQPAGIQDANGSYLHITSEAAMASGVQNCCFAAADGLCTAAGNHFAAMSTDVSTVGQSEVVFSFWWLCGGGSNNYGEVYYSTDGGAAWTLLTAPIAQYRAQATWIQQSISSTAFNGQAQLRFGFRFVNGTSLDAVDPGFGVDDVRIIASAATNAITTSAFSPLSVCSGSEVMVPFTLTGGFNTGNTFTAQLSDPSGSFTTPVVVGTMVGNTSGSIIATIPLGTAPGSGYRIRVVSSDPPVVGVVSSSVLQVVAAPVAGNDVALDHCTADPSPDLFALVDGGSANGEFHYQGLPLLPDLSVPGDYEVHYVVAGSVGCPADSATFDIHAVAAPNAGTGISITVCSYDEAFSLFALLTGGPQTGGTWSDPQGGTHSGSFDPSTDAPGLYTYEVGGMAPCDPDRAFIAIAIDPCVGIAERAAMPSQWLGQQGNDHLFSLPAGRMASDVIVLDATGRTVRAGIEPQTQHDRIRIAFTGLPSGLYFVRIKDLPVIRVVHRM